ncbi:MAG: M23 family metallopeptidase [Bacteroidetes bacterium]|nr:M23 family metallopeptidase [Bacteroidota bacterium]
MLKNSKKKSNKMSRQQKLHFNIYKILFVFGLVFLASHFNVVSANAILYHDTDGFNPGIDMNQTAVIPGVSPFFDIYSYWDTLNLDPYKFDFATVTGQFNLTVLESDCGFALPVAGAMTSGFGWRWGHAHTGVDLNLKTGDTVSSAFDGVVRMSTWYYGYGNCVVIRHHNGLETLYGHLSKRLVKPGDLVNAGQTIGLGGSTGYSTGPHLHFETRFMGKAFNPLGLIDFKSDSLLKDTLAFDKTSFAMPAPVYYNRYRRPYYRNSYYRKPTAAVRKPVAKKK